jgi:hypothetical protein
MSILSKVQKTQVKAPRMTIYGKPGIGKSTLANSFPKPLFLLTEENGIVGADCLPVSASFEEFWDNVKGVCEEEHDYKTIVIDSISMLDNLVVEYIISKDNKGTTLASACGGYGAGYAKAASIHRAIKSKLDSLQNKGITVLYVAHMAVKAHRCPDTEDYDIYSIVANHDKTREVYIDDMDAVLFCKMRSFVNETDKGRKIIKSTEDRLIVTGSSDANVSKNRFNMPNEIPMSYQSIAKYIPFYNKQEK